MAVRLRPVVGGGCERIAGLLLRRNNRTLVASLEFTNRQTRVSYLLLSDGNKSCLVIYWWTDWAPLKHVFRVAGLAE